MPLPISIVIATSDRGFLLTRTLESISACQLPPVLKHLVVVENGPVGNTAEVVRRFAERIPVVYEHVPTANKSRALNHVLQQSADELMVFLDDDVRVLPTTFLAYAEAARECVSGFWGGRCHVDYEDQPPNWLIPFLPSSVTGWDLGDDCRRLDEPSALGCNWAAFTRELKALSGFDEQRGPGTRARGQETDMQRRLLQAGVQGSYLPGAAVWHYVPKSRCSEEWALQRCRQMAHHHGVVVSRKNRLKRLRHDWLCAAKICAYETSLRYAQFPLPPSRRFHLRYWREWFIGIRQGIHHGS